MSKRTQHLGTPIKKRNGEALIHGKGNHESLPTEFGIPHRLGSCVPLLILLRENLVGFGVSYQLEEVWCRDPGWHDPFRVRHRFEDLWVFVWCVEDFQDGGNVAAPVAVIGSAPNCHQLLIENVLVTWKVQGHHFMESFLFENLIIVGHILMHILMKPN